MASITTGEMYTQKQFDAMSVTERASLDLVQVAPQEEATLESMTLEQRKDWLKTHKSKKPSRRVLNKRERQNKKRARVQRS